ncbi:MAG: DMT family transporter [Sulfurovum sp.]|nr:DMT family transporter [Sulfurovum sp.]
MKKETKGMLLGLLGVTIFGLTLPMTKMIIPYLNPIFIGLGRSVFATFIAIVLLWKFSKDIPTKKQIYQLVVVALGVVIGFPIFTAIAMQSVPASHGAVVIGVLPLVTAVFGTIISKDKPSFSFWVVSFIGTSLVIVYALWEGGGSFQYADLNLFIAVSLVGMGYAVGAKLSIELGGWQVICWALVLSFPFIVLPTIYYVPNRLFDFPLSTYFGFLYLTVMSQLFGFFFWYKGLSIGGIARVSQVQLMQTFITLIASYYLLDEKLNIQIFVFSTLVVWFVWLGKRMPIKTLNTVRH